MKFLEAFRLQFELPGPSGDKLQPLTEEGVAGLKCKESYFGTEFKPGDYTLFALVEVLPPTVPGEKESMIVSVNNRDNVRINSEYNLSHLKGSSLLPLLEKK